ncbi:MAG: tripartite tricarboxylate transporter substrate binding protein [bacterium]|jgi:putative tricarboxylic transport membrane protein
MRISKRVVVASLMAVLVLSSMVLGGCSQKEETFPAQSIEVIVGWGAGGGTDVFARGLCAAAEDILGVPLAVVNMPGANSATAMDYVLKQETDGYTVFAITSDLLTAQALGLLQTSVDNLDTLIRAHVDVGMIQVGKNSPFTTWDEFVTYAKENPHTVTVGGTGAGSYDDIAASIIMKSAGVEVKYVPFDSASEMHAALMGGHIMAMHEETGPTIGYIEAGETWPILVAADKRLEAFADVPCAQELGVNYVPMQWRGVAVKKGTPEEIVKVLEDAFAKAWETEQYKTFEEERYLDLYPGFQRGNEFYESMLDELDQYTEYVKELGL